MCAGRREALAVTKRPLSLHAQRDNSPRAMVMAEQTTETTNKVALQKRTLMSRSARVASLLFGRPRPFKYPPLACLFFLAARKLAPAPPIRMSDASI